MDAPGCECVTLQFLQYRPQCRRPGNERISRIPLIIGPMSSSFKVTLLYIVLLIFRCYRFPWMADSAVWISPLVQHQLTVVRSIREASLLATRRRMDGLRKDAQLLSADRRWLPRPSQLQVYENNLWKRQRRTRRHLDADSRPRRLVSYCYTLPYYITPHHAIYTCYTTPHYKTIKYIILLCITLLFFTLRCTRLH